jgi:hypothetical protein
MGKGPDKTKDLEEVLKERNLNWRITESRYWGKKPYECGYFSELWPRTERRLVKRHREKTGAAANYNTPHSLDQKSQLLR